MPAPRVALGLEPLRRVAASALSSLVLLAACGGDSERQLSDTPVPLVTKSDVVRELRIVNYFLIYGDGEAQYGPSLADGKRRHGPLPRWLTRTPAKAEAANCDSGSGETVEGRKQRSFEFFGVSRQVDYSIGTFAACRRTDVSGVDAVTMDGVLEDGESPSGEYSYLLAGDGRKPALMTFELDGAVFHQGVRGLFEYRSTSTLYEQRQTAVFNFDHDAGSAILGEFGSSGEPFVETDGGGRYTADGPYRYNSTECEGGSVRLETVSPMVISRGYPSGGMLRFTSGTASATVVIRSDNGATVYFADGSSASITPAEMRELYDDLDTDCVRPRFPEQSS